MAFGQQNNRIIGRPSSNRENGEKPETFSSDNDTAKKEWITIAALYDIWHGALTFKIAAGRYGTSFLLNIAKIFQDRRGVEGGDGKTYDHANSLWISLTIAELIHIKRLMKNFKERKLDSFVFTRFSNKEKVPDKVLVFSSAENFYQEGTPEYDLNKGALVISIEEYKDKYREGISPSDTYFFMARPVVINITDSETETVYPDLDTFEAIIDSYLPEVSRIGLADALFASSNTRQESNPQEQRSVASMPIRRGNLPITRPSSEIKYSEDGMTASASDVDSILGDQGFTSIEESDEIPF